MTTATQVKERPILFRADMVRAILEGRKTMTRRPVKPQPVADARWEGGWKIVTKKQTTGIGSVDCYRDVCPYGHSGDRLLVFLPKRETCPVCGYTYKDKKIHMDHNLCSVNDLELEIVSVRVERIQDIPAADLKAEGIRNGYDHPEHGTPNWREKFMASWMRTYPGSWDRNDWVWVIEFRKVQP